MAISTRPFVMTGAALASVAAIATAAPAIVPGQIAGVPSPAKLSTAQFELTAISDISFAGISDALSAGWGGYIGPSDIYYPGDFNNDTKVTGPTGVAYYLLDNALDGVDPYNLENYFFEVGAKAGDVVAGLGAVAYVGAGSVLGVDSPVTQLVKSLVSGGGTGGTDIGALIMNATAGIPVVGDLASVYFTGQIAGDATVYGTGFAGLLSYTTTKLLPSINLTGLVSGIKGFISQVSGLIGGHGFSDHGSHHSHSDEAEGTDTDTDTDTDGPDSSESETASVVSQHGDKHHSAAAVAARVASSVKAPAAAATAAKPAASENTGTDVEPVALTAPAPETETADADGSATGAPLGASPKRAHRAQAAQAGEKAAGARHEGKRGKAGHSAN